MMHREFGGEKELAFLSKVAEPTGRRQFLKWSGVTLAVAAVGCSSDAIVAPGAGDGLAGTGPASSNHGVSLGTGDVMVLNFALALEQLEAAFYTQVIATPYSGITGQEMTILDDLRKHEVIHREFLREALGDAAIPMLEFDFTSVNFNNRESVLTTARTFEDLGVSAYNGAGKFLENLNFLLVAGKIVSVEARHAAAIRDVLQPRTTAFAGDDVVNEQGLDVVRTPAQVAAAAAPFIVTPINTSTLPNS